MPITSYELVEPPYKYHGQTILRIKYTDHTGKSRVLRRVSDENPDDYMAAHVVEVEKMLKSIELRSIEGRIRNGEKPKEVYKSRDWAGKADTKAVILEVLGAMESEITERQRATSEKAEIEAQE